MHKLGFLFYMYDGILASPLTASLQEVSDVPTGLFYKVRLHKNVEKTFVLVFQPCRTMDSQSE